MPTITRISPDEAHAKQQEGWTYVDVRSELEFVEGHPAGAMNVPLLHAGPGGMRPNPDFMRVMAANFPKDAKLVLGCRSGGRSMHAAEMLLADGYSQLLEQRAGWDGSQDATGQLEPGWGRTTLPKETDTPAERTYASLAKKAVAAP